MTVNATLLIALEDTAEAERRARELRALGSECELASNLETVLDSLADGPFLALLLDWNSERGSALLRSAVARHPDIRVIALVDEDLGAIVEAMRARSAMRYAGRRASK
jgi:DNA-binding NtrC family response regulator